MRKKRSPGRWLTPRKKTINNLSPYGIPFALIEYVRQDLQSIIEPARGA
jgi:hypothetical protein